MKQRWLTTTIGGLLLVLPVAVVTAAMIFLQEPRVPVVTAAPVQSVPRQAAQGNATTVIVGNYGGAVALTWVLGGVYSDPLPTPTPAPGNATRPELGAVNLGLQLSQTNSAVSGYINLEQTLIVSAMHTLADGTKIGPLVTGAFDGVNLTLTSERFQTVLDGKSIERQFYLSGQVGGADGATIRGEYRETLWGYAAEPYTVMGNVTLQRSVVNPGGVDDNNRAPTVSSDAATTNQGVAVSIPVLANDSDPDGTVLTITGVSQPQFGAATTDGQSVTYTPNAAFVGVDHFSYFVSDGKGGDVAGSVTVTVIGPGGPNQPPIAGNDNVGTTPGTAITINVLANDSDPNGDALLISIDSQPAHGTAVVQNGQIVYTPQAGYVGLDSFTYTVSDGKGGTATATVTVTVSTSGQPSANPLYLPLVYR